MADWAIVTIAIVQAVATLVGVILGKWKWK